ncbi:hypothetical protein SASPL_103076 [Salvia splendens]|uniref:EF-hand domain-containing protein n=1 Tax=Salvia splendens TaxID=180675 RepID=A0A8X8YTQ9_SALSN|nr:hypothetical protein SASPL_103076 [Salvia splendens]
MAFKTSSTPRSKEGKVEVTMDEFKRWLKKFDDNGDGQISVEELREAIRATGGWFSTAKASRIFKSVDTKSKGFIDDSQIPMLQLFAQKQFGLKIVA